MTGWGVERRPRTAHRPSSVSPAGVSALMPPPSQGAERRTERHAARTGLRVLVIGGLSGAARPFTGAAAHAADRDHVPEGLVDLMPAALLPVAMGEQAVASHRLPLATDVKARQHDAEAQTASPD